MLRCGLAFALAGIALGVDTVCYESKWALLPEYSNVAENADLNTVYPVLKTESTRRNRFGPFESETGTLVTIITDNVNNGRMVLYVAAGREPRPTDYDCAVSSGDVKKQCFVANFGEPVYVYTRTKLTREERLNGSPYGIAEVQVQVNQYQSSESSDSVEFVASDDESREETKNASEELEEVGLLGLTKYEFPRRNEERRLYGSFESRTGVLVMLDSNPEVQLYAAIGREPKERDFDCAVTGSRNFKDCVLDTNKGDEVYVLVVNPSRSFYWLEVRVDLEEAISNSFTLPDVGVSDVNFAFDVNPNWLRKAIDSGFKGRSVELFRSQRGPAEYGPFESSTGTLVTTFSDTPVKLYVAAGRRPTARDNDCTVDITSSKQQCFIDRRKNKDEDVYILTEGFESSTGVLGTYFVEIRTE